MLVERVCISFSDYPDQLSSRPGKDSEVQKEPQKPQQETPKVVIPPHSLWRKDNEGEVIPKSQGQIWEALADGSCMFYCVAGKNDPIAAANLRLHVAQFVNTHWSVVLEDLDITPEQFAWQHVLAKG